MTRNKSKIVIHSIFLLFSLEWWYERLQRCLLETRNFIYAKRMFQIYFAIVTKKESKAAVDRLIYETKQRVCDLEIKWRETRRLLLGFRVELLKVKEEEIFIEKLIRKRKDSSHFAWTRLWIKNLVSKSSLQYTKKCF